MVGFLTTPFPFTYKKRLFFACFVAVGIYIANGMDTFSVAMQAALLKNSKKKKPAFEGNTQNILVPLVTSLILYVINAVEGLIDEQFLKHFEAITQVLLENGGIQGRRGHSIVADYGEEDGESDDSGEDGHVEDAQGDVTRCVGSIPKSGGPKERSPSSNRGSSRKSFKRASSRGRGKSARADGVQASTQIAPTTSSDSLSISTTTTTTPDTESRITHPPKKRVKLMDANIEKNQPSLPFPPSYPSTSSDPPNYFADEDASQSLFDL